MKNNKGITLVALVITIIVLLILAAVSINLALGDNGVLNRASTATLSNEKAEVKEDLDFVLSSAYTDYLSTPNSKMRAIFEKDTHKIIRDNVRGDIGNIEITDTNCTGLIIKNTGRQYYFDIDFTNKTVTIRGLDEPVELTNIYATLYTDGTLSFCTNKSKIEEKTVQKEYGNIREKSYSGNWVFYATINGNDQYKWIPDTPWCNENASIKYINFQDEVVPIATSNLFAGCINLERIDNIQNLNTSLANNMECMFYGCRKLTEVDLSTFDTSNVTSFHSMFDGGIEGNMSISRILGMENWDTSNVTDMGWMFAQCPNLNTFDVTHFDTSKVNQMSALFCNCQSITSLDISNFDTTNVEYMEAFFSECTNLTTIDLSGFNISKLKNSKWMFSGDTKLKTIYIGDGWDSNSIIESDWMFQNCTNIVGGSGTTYNSSKVDKTYARIDGGNSNPGYLTFKEL